MAEIAVLLVVKKIGIAVAGETIKFAGPLLSKKSQSIAALPDDMRLMKNDLELIHVFLKEIGRKDGRGEVIEVWIQQVRRLAYDMEDIVDQFIYVVGQHNQKGSWWSYILKIVKKPQSLFSLDEIATEVKRINQELKQLIQNKSTWALDGVTDISVARYETGQDMYLCGYDYSINDEDPVGPDQNKQTLIDSLHSQDPSLQISAVWGMGGIGKSTLVNNVYKNEISNFDCHAWISISQSYELEDIWRKMLRDLLGKENRNFDFETKNNTELRAELKKILGGKNRYLIVLDDVWAAKDLLKIKEVLVDNGLRSRVIVTTRIDEVASIAEDDYKIKVEPLDDHYAWLLFCRNAFPRSASHSCPDDLLQLGKEIVLKCKGLPLAIVAIGSLMSLKPKTIDVWKRFYDQLIWELHNNENLNHVEKIINLSYKYLPDYLKNCFLYCAMFPEDDLIDRKKLIRLWTAEGFIEHNGGQCSLEEVAEGYMEDLVRRSMLQVVRRNSLGRIKRLQMHDLVRALAIFQSAKESFSTTYDDTHGTVQVALAPRRASVLRCNRDSQLRIDSSRLRTFLVFDTSMVLSPWPAFIPSESKYLAVLDLSGLPIENIPDSIGQLFNLKYLCLDNTNVKVLPNSITKLHNLETLSLANTKCLNFPKGFANLRKLRDLLIWTMLDRSWKDFNISESMEPFEGLWKLKELRSLASVRASKVAVAKLGNFSQLGHLSITDVKSSYCAQMCHSLSKMHQLLKLEIRATNKEEMLHLETLTLPNPLRKIALVGRLSEGTLQSPFFRTHGNALLELWLLWSQFEENIIPRLSELSNLTSLYLQSSYNGQQITFCEEWFPNLKEMTLEGLPNVNKICIQDKALASLESLFIYGLQELREVPVGVEFLASIKEAYIIDMHPDFVRSVQNANLGDYIPKVHIYYYHQAARSSLTRIIPSCMQGLQILSSIRDPLFG